MTITEILFRLKMFNEKMEFMIILFFLLFFPDKTSAAYFLIFSILISFFIFRRIITSGNIGISGFSMGLLIFNILLIITTFTSRYILNSLLFTFDILLVSIYFIARFHETREDISNLRVISYMITLFSLIRLTVFIISGDNTFFFKNPILSGVTSGAAILILLNIIIKKFRIFDFGCLCISAASLYISASKAAFLGVIILSVYMILQKRRKVIFYVLAIILLTVIIPNPVIKMFKHSLSEDPYSANRIDIWKLSLRMFQAFPLTGVGADNFSELSPQFNFKQKKGPANYFKTPRSPHSDYLKIISETGIIGLIFLLFLAFALFKKIFRGDLGDIRKILLLYILFQCLLFNIIFKIFFFFFFLFLIRSLFPENSRFISLTPFINISIFFILVLTILAGYIIPFIAEKKISEAKNASTLDAALKNLQTASIYNPLDAQIHYARAKIYFELFKKSSNIDFFLLTMSDIKKAKNLNRRYAAPYLLESDLFLSIAKRGIMYEGLMDEIIEPLKKHEKFDPFNPFVKLGEADILMRFGKKETAKIMALEALKIEPNFISAIYFLHTNLNFYKTEENFRSKIKKVLQKRKGLNFSPGSYLESLYRIPGKMKEEFPGLK